MSSFHCSALFLLPLFLTLFSCQPYEVATVNVMYGVNREALEVITGGGGGGGGGGAHAGGGGFALCPPSTPPPPPRRMFINKRIEKSYHIIHKLKSKVKHDPKGITKTWQGTNVCNYAGFLCYKNPAHKETVIAGVDFNGFSLAGPDLALAGFLDELPDLNVFHANSNHFLGGLPNRIDKLRYFAEIDLSNNKLSGAFPIQILAATNLTFLDLRFNSFSGSIPPQIFSLDVNAIFINNNRFNQPLPSNIGSTPAPYLTFANNEFTGPIPKSIGLGLARGNLVEVLFLNNKLSGCLPYEMGLLEKAALLDMSKNRLTGPIPHSFACLGGMEVLNLGENQFYGPVPEVVCKLPKLRNLTLRNNYFTEVGPECRNLIQNGIVDISKNCILDLPGQRSKGECEEFLLRPKYCQNEKWLAYVPCKNNCYLNQSNCSSGPSRPVSSSPSSMRSYGALIPH